MSRESVTRRKNRAGYQSLLEINAEKIHNKLSDVVNRSVNELEALLSDPDPKIRLGAAALALKFLPTNDPSRTQNLSIEALVNQPNFVEDLSKLPGVGHRLIMEMLKRPSK